MRKRWLLGLLALGLVGSAVLAIQKSTIQKSTIQKSTIQKSTVQAHLQADDTFVAEHAVVRIPLSGPLADRKAEISGLAWWGDRLILLPQYPERMGGQIFAIGKAEIVNWLERGNGEAALLAEAIAFDDGEIGEMIEGYEGYEAIAFQMPAQTPAQAPAQAPSAFLAIESETGDGTLGYIVTATMHEDGSRLIVDPSSRVEVRPQSTSPNKSEESLLLTDAQIISLYEVNGESLNPDPVAHSFTLSLAETASIPFPQIDYRITDATALDQQNRFWAINYFYPGDSDLAVDQDPLSARYGEGETHQQQAAVERLVEFVYAPDGIVMADRPPIQLMLEEDARNWEGIVRLGDRGFLLVTDKFPDTILGFVEK